MDTAVYTTTYNNERSYWWYTARLRILESIFPAFILQKPNLRLMIVGGGTGATSKKFSKYGTTITLDISSSALGFCKLRGLEGLIKGDAMCLPFQQNSSDIIMACDIVEHLDNDFSALQEMNRCLSTDGTLILTVPAYRFMWSKLDNIVGHKRRYTKKILQEVVEKAKFRIIKISYFNTFLFPLALLQRTYEKLLSKQISGENFLPRLPPFLNRILHLIFVSEKFYLRYFKFPFGLSIILVARQKS